MSYILDALRKSDQQRQLGAAPKLHMGQMAAAEPKQPAYMYYGVLAAVLLCAGIAIGWLRPWQVAPSAPPVNVAAAKLPEANVAQPAPVRTEVAPAPVPAPEPQLPRAAPLVAVAPAPAAAPVPTPAPAPVRAAAPAAAKAAAPASASAPVVAAAGSPPAPAPAKVQSPANAKTESSVKAQDAAVPARAPMNEPPPTPPAPAPVQNVIWLAELPIALQQELPPMTISVHAYSARPSDRMVGINNRMLREGEFVAPGLKLEQITPEGMVLGYKGYSFRRGVK
jgi:general secretion pathway protein B